MEQEKMLTKELVAQPRKPYTKPVLNLVHLVASEAVLALCKYNSPGQGVNILCAPDLSCISTARS
ncbi:MAG: hypothetical protein A2Z16_08195 [Chloroflexi bacterium RBG_16_54_18]|nr:MAG: hypothetical protein A2Z16_08195 [Chloroflexi bacterium RBG_16_54_18]